MTRSFLEVDQDNDDHIFSNNDDPITVFLETIHSKYKCTKQIQQTNNSLLRQLIDNGHISKPSIIWDKANIKIIKIYGLSIDENGHIRYEKNEVQKSLDTPAKIGTKVTSFYLSSIKSAITKSKEIHFYDNKA